MLALMFCSVCLSLDDAGKLEVGKPLPDFTMKGSDGKTYKLADFKGKKGFVMAWYPKAETKGCTAECKSMAENKSELDELGIAYFGASVDSVEANKKFASKLGAEYALLCDPEKKAAKAFGVLGQRGVANRVTIYVDKEGVVKFVDKSVKVQSHGKDIVAKAKELKLNG